MFQPFAAIERKPQNSAISDPFRGDALAFGGASTTYQQC